MKFSYNWLQSCIKGRLPKPEKLAEFLTMYSFEISKIEKINNPKDCVLDIDILPNRMPDCACHSGVAREIYANLKARGAKTGGVICLSSDFKKNPKLRTKDYLKLKVKELDLCPRYMGFLVRNVKVAPSPKWLQDRLLAIGQRPINNIVDITNYIMLDTGQPLHAFDLEKLDGREILVRRAKESEKITTLDGKTFSLRPANLVIADKNDALAIAGIKGGKKAEITGKTKDIIIEAAVFNPANIRNTSRMLNLKTDASSRFESGLSFFLPEIAILKAVSAVCEIAGGEAAMSPVDFCAKKLRMPEIAISETDIYKLTGCVMSGAQAKKILEDLNFSVVKKGEEGYLVRPPKERTDIQIKEDVIEEAVRIYGYDKIPNTVPGEILIPPQRNHEYFYSGIIRETLTGLGFSEVYNYSFVKTGPAELKIQNPISADKAYLRENLLDGLRRNAEENFRYFDIVKIFEIGKVFYPLTSRVGEEAKVSAFVGYKADKKKEADVFYETKGVAETCLSKLGVNDVWFKEHREKTAEILAGNEILGRIEADGFELDILKIISLAEEDQAYKPVSRFPATTRDLALFTPFNTKVDEILDVIENTAGPLLVDTDLFDLYMPENESRKSLAFRLVFQSEETTLSDEEVNKIMVKITKELEKNIEWEVRK